MDCALCTDIGTPLSTSKPIRDAFPVASYMVLDTFLVASYTTLDSFRVASCPAGDQLGQGFTRLLMSAEDLVLDNPDAAHLLSLFIGRIIVDEVLPPSFLTTVLGVLPDNCLGVQIVQTTGENRFQV